MEEALARKAGPASRKEQQAVVARERIVHAVVECLDQHGYAETSINRIQERAGISRGALTHHFPSKEELMVVTAERLLKPTLVPLRKGPRPMATPEERKATIEADIVWMWERLVDTREGRALLEILVASRTDLALKGRISETFSRWNHTISDSLVVNYLGLGVAEDELREIWTMCRVFLRGLNTQNQFEADEQARRALVRSFARMIAARLA
ncbi:helix-turn-helix domain-containing protein [Mesorhizobium sp. CAU 1741]|uniref:TetR/AcrR family transcriptional regulator n=1 Tax=Mesorhizobium sp. CAU 1741 TaxID=3140366 RepID=UPI00325C32E9